MTKPPEPSKRFKHSLSSFVVNFQFVTCTTPTQTYTVTARDRVFDAIRVERTLWPAIYTGSYSYALRPKSYLTINHFPRAKLARALGRDVMLSFAIFLSIPLRSWVCVTVVSSSHVINGSRKWLNHIAEYLTELRAYYVVQARRSQRKIREPICNSYDKHTQTNVHSITHTQIIDILCKEQSKEGNGPWEGNLLSITHVHKYIGGHYDDER